MGSNPIGKRLSPRPLNYSGFMKEEIQYSKLQQGVSWKQEQATKEATCPSQSSWLSKQEEFPSALQIPSSTATQYRWARPEVATARSGTSSVAWRNPHLTRGYVCQGCIGDGMSWVAHTWSGLSDFKVNVMTLVFLLPKLVRIMRCEQWLSCPPGSAGRLEKRQTTQPSPPRLKHKHSRASSGKSCSFAELLIPHLHASKHNHVPPRQKQEWALPLSNLVELDNLSPSAGYQWGARIWGRRSLQSLLPQSIYLCDGWGTLADSLHEIGRDTWSCS